jgi:hypothetical protein
MHVSRSKAALIATALIVGLHGAACHDTRSPNPTEPALHPFQQPDSGIRVGTSLPRTTTSGCVKNTPQGSYPDPRASCVEVFGVSTINVGEHQTLDCHGWGPVQIGTTVQSYPVGAGHPSSWSVSPSGIAAVNQQSTDYTAIVTGVAPGSATVTCYIDGIAGGIAVAVAGTRTLQSINLTPSTYTLYPGQRVQETPHFVDNYGATDRITPPPTISGWSSDNTAIATVSPSGLVTASANPAASGIAHIRATSGGITSSPATISVIPKTVVSVTITGPAQPIGITGAYTWTANPQTNDTYTYVWEYLAAGSSTWQAVGSARTYTRTLAANDPDFTLRVTLSSATRTGGATLFVNLGQPLEAPLAAVINGPSYIDQLGSYSWSSSAAGGVAPLSYRWEINYLLRPMWGPIGTNATSVSFMVSPDDGSFQLRLTVTSATGRQAAVADYQITVTGGSSCGTQFIC